MEELKKPTQKDLKMKVRGKGWHYADGSFEFYPEPGEKGVLYEPVGKPLKDASLQKSIKSYKVQARVPVDSPDPGAALLEKVSTVLKPLEPKSAPQLSRAKVVGKTPHATVRISGASALVEFTIPLYELNPAFEGQDMERLLKAGINPYVEPQSVLVKEVPEVCSIISTTLTIPRSKSAQKKTSRKS